MVRVLIVDDNADSARSLAVLTKLWGHCVEVLHDGMAVEAAVRRYAPDIVLLDLGLPGLNGCEIAQRLRAADLARQPFLVAVTGRTEAEDHQRTTEAGFDCHLAKPVDLDFLERMLAETPSRDGDGTPA